MSSTHDPIISLATPQDLDGLISLAKETCLETYGSLGKKPDGIVETYAAEKYNRERLRPCLENGSLKFPTYVTGRLDGQLAGYSSLELIDQPVAVKNRNSICFSGVFVLRRFQGHGFGRLFFKCRKDIAKKRGYTGIWLCVWKLNESAVEFHQRMGFKVVGEYEWRFNSGDQSWVCDDWIMYQDI